MGTPGPSVPTTAKSMKTSEKNKLNSHPFKLFRDYPNSPLCAKRREFRLELKRGERARVQTEIVEMIYRPAVSVLK